MTAKTRAQLHWELSDAEKQIRALKDRLRLLEQKDDKRLKRIAVRASKQDAEEAWRRIL